MEILPVDEYITQRRMTGGLRPLFGLVELCLDLEIPEEVINHPILRRMSDTAIDIVHWINVSLDKLIYCMHHFDVLIRIYPRIKKSLCKMA